MLFLPFEPRLGYLCTCVKFRYSLNKIFKMIRDLLINLLKKIKMRFCWFVRVFLFLFEIKRFFLSLEWTLNMENIWNGLRRSCVCLSHHVWTTLCAFTFTWMIICKLSDWNSKTYWISLCLQLIDWWLFYVLLSIIRWNQSTKMSTF